MQFTAAQVATFKTWLTANASSLNDQASADLANTLANPAYFIWQSAVPPTVLDAQVVKANYTPADAPPASPSTDMTYQNRALLAQLKQTNAQWMTQATRVTALDARSVSVRQNLKDCLTSIPTGASGANQDAGWGTAGAPGAVRLAMMRQVSNVEKLFVIVITGPGNDDVVGDRGKTINPDTLALGADGLAMEGPVSSGQIAEVRAS